MVHSSRLVIDVDGEHLTCSGFFFGETICFGSLEFIVDCFGSLNFKTSGIEKYDGSTNLTEWLKVYQLAIEAAGGDSYVTTNYLPVCLSSSTRT
jgi:hypothetical protein